MTDTIFLAGGSGVVGLNLIPRLRKDGWRVVATTQSEAKFQFLEQAGAEPLIMDAFDEQRVMDAVTALRPSVIMNQLTSLPDGLDPEQMPIARERNAKIRDIGTRNLAAAAKASGTTRLVSQSIAFAYAQGTPPYSEEDRLDPSQWGVASLEKQTLGGQLTGLVLRYGYFYGPGTGFEFRTRPGSIHIEDAAEAASIAARHGDAGIYNIAEDDGMFDVSKASAQLHFKARLHDS